MVSTQKSSRCPICKKPVVAQFYPFCSQRCKLIDFSHWLKGTYVIPGTESPITEDEKDEEEQS